jgi:hypothetical protein
VQRVHPEDHLLEGPARQTAHEQGVQLVQRHAFRPEHAAVLADEPRRRDRHDLMAAGGERLADPARVPRPGRSQDADAHQAANERSSTSGASEPPWKVRPESLLVSATTAGLNSIGSIS